MIWLLITNLTVPPTSPIPPTPPTPPTPPNPPTNLTNPANATTLHYSRSDVFVSRDDLQAVGLEFAPPERGDGQSAGRGMGPDSRVGRDRRDGQQDNVASFKISRGRLDVSGRGLESLRPLQRLLDHVDGHQRAAAEMVGSQSWVVSHPCALPIYKYRSSDACCISLTAHSPAGTPTTRYFTSNPHHHPHPNPNSHPHPKPHPQLPTPPPSPSSRSSKAWSTSSLTTSPIW